MAWEKSDIDRYCECRWFERAAAEPYVPIEFDEKLNEYHLVHGANRAAKMSMYFCPFCGCKAPASRRASLFATMTHAELERVRNLTKDVKTVDDALRTLGEPDDDFQGGGGTISPESGTDPPKAIFYERCLGYRRLSDTIDVRVQVQASGSDSAKCRPSEE